MQRSRSSPIWWPAFHTPPVRLFLSRLGNVLPSPHTMPICPGSCCSRWCSARETASNGPLSEFDTSSKGVDGIFLGDTFGCRLSPASGTISNEPSVGHFVSSKQVDGILRGDMQACGLSAASQTTSNEPRVGSFQRIRQNTKNFVVTQTSLVNEPSVGYFVSSTQVDGISKGNTNAGRLSAALGTTSNDPLAGYSFSSTQVGGISRGDTHACRWSSASRTISNGSLGQFFVPSNQVDATSVGGTQTRGLSTAPGTASNGSLFQFDTSPKRVDGISQGDTQEISLEDAQGISLEDTQGISLEDTQGISKEDTQGVSLEDMQGISPEDTQGIPLEDTQEISRGDMQRTTLRDMQWISLGETQACQLSIASGTNSSGPEYEFRVASQDLQGMLGGSSHRCGGHVNISEDLCILFFTKGRRHSTALTVVFDDEKGRRLSLAEWKAAHPGVVMEEGKTIMVSSYESGQLHGFRFTTRPFGCETGCFNGLKFSLSTWGRSARGFALLGSPSTLRVFNPKLGSSEVEKEGEDDDLFRPISWEDVITCFNSSRSA